MTFIMQLFGIPLGWIMHFIYKVIPNYGIALLVFTILSRLAMFPLSIKQQASTAKMALLQPRVKEIQQKYSHDRTLMQEEISKLYAEENYNPTGGCLPLLIQMPILFGLIDVIYRPLTHILRFSDGLIGKATKLFHLLGLSNTNPNMLEMDLISAARSHPLFFGLLGATNLASLSEINYSFLGMNLMTKPDWTMLTGIFTGNFNPVIFIPFLSGLTAFLMSYLTMKYSKENSGGGDAQSAGMMRGMMMTMPLMSLWIAFTVPAGVGLYWVYSNICGIFQNMYINKFHNPKELQDKMRAEQEAKREKERQERIETKQKIKAGLLGAEHAEKAMSQKEIDRLKLAEARKRDALKYGDPLDDDEA